MEKINAQLYFMKYVYMSVFLSQTTFQGWRENTKHPHTKNSGICDDPGRQQSYQLLNN